MPLKIITFRWFKSANPCEAFRWAVVRLLDRHPGTCRTNLVLWAVSPYPWKWFWQDAWSQSCDDEHGAYCGKCAVTGRIKR